MAGEKAQFLFFHLVVPPLLTNVIFLVFSHHRERHVKVIESSIRHVVTSSRRQVVTSSCVV